MTCWPRASARASTGRCSWLWRSPPPTTRRALTRLTDALRPTPGVASVATPQLNPAGTAAAVLAYPATSPQSAQTSSLVTRLRDRLIPPIEQSTHARVFVGGATASQVDFAHILASKLPLFIAIVVAWRRCC